MVELRAGPAAAGVDPEGGGRLTRLAVGGVELLAPAGCFVMAPWVGRTGWGRFTHDGVVHRLPVDMAPHAIHGTVRGVAWSVVDADDHRCVLTATLGPVWPWPAWCEHVVELAADHLALHLSLHADETPFPAAVGWHPWLRKPEHIALEADALLERGDDHLPTGARSAPDVPGDKPLDDCYEGVRWPALVRLPDGIDLRIEADGCRYAVLYDEQEATTCVEPQTAPPDALNSGEATIVSPGKPLRATMRLRWSTR